MSALIAAMSYLRRNGCTMISKSDYKYFDKAKRIAAISDYHKIHIGCVAVYQGNIIGVACNTNKTHPTQKYYNRFREESDVLMPKLHAEINCINQIKHLDINFSKVKLYIYRIRNDKPYGMSRKYNVLHGGISETTMESAA